MHHLLSTLTIVFLSCIVSSHGACNQRDHDSLSSFLSSLSSPSLNWTSSIDCCLWEGIQCNSDGLVTDLWLPGRGLEGMLVPSLGNLTNLSHLNLSHNRLQGPLPYEIFASLTSLQTLDLSYNQLSGELPAASLLSRNVEVIDLSSNKFQGVISPSIFQKAENLTSFNISNNGFTGPIPSMSRNFSCPFSLLDFSYNDFNGQILHGLGECSKLQIFRAGYNSLSGGLPDDIYDATAMEMLSIPRNQLTGAIENGITRLTNLTTLDLSSNQFTGSIPRDIGKLSNLQYLLLHKNNLTGFLPSSLTNCTNLSTLNLRDNFLAGEISNFSFSSFLKLRVLDLGMNKFFGSFPLSLYSCKSLTALRLARSNLTGQILPDILELQSLSFLSVAANKLTNVSGAIRLLKDAKNLEVLMLTENFFDESMPDAENMQLDGFANLKYLALRGCQLHGPVPVWLAKLKKLQYLNLSINRITGFIPGWLWTLPQLYYIDLSANLISGKLTKEVGGLAALRSKPPGNQQDETYLELPILILANGTFNEYNQLSYLPRILYLQNNSLNGTIPIEIGHLKLMQYLDLSNNNFSGTIPDQLSNLTNLEELYLYRNHFSGKIPDSLKSLSFLARFSVANNNLQGEVPSGGQFDTFPISSFEGNPRLCGSIVNRSCDDVLSPPETRTPVESPDKSLGDNEFVVGIVSGIGFGFVVGTVSGLLYPVHKILLVRRNGWQEFVPLKWLELTNY